MYKTVQGVERGLKILETINEIGCRATCHQISVITGIHRTTVRRYLETLVALNYIQRSADDTFFYLSPNVRKLSDGYRHESVHSPKTLELMNELTAHVMWPADLSTFKLDSMLVIESTHRSSRLSLTTSMIGKRLPMLMTASGKAYLANCSDKQRKYILDILKNGTSLDARLAGDETYLNRVLAETRRKGYGQNSGEWGEYSKIASIAVPVYVQGELFGSLNIIFHRSYMSPDEAAEKFYDYMLEKARLIGESLRI
ncbi:helix-turn-helix domain-containing protein [Marinobacter daepoensis]|uniref:Helix-turn-helix domain-containing protein n=1 Tax=Marinobacter daepoensis TaxID=262077 RepID=A0ABS3B947_9GAMM|nr:IclR family transcriptional regulator C-terminal domain-containing protein [Marinobacter daepoensis]MBN7768376.1 helix-turn-helix domain-containing protein [Marinobacter daepoensis]MBY6034517.1 helix-turn-helix domain-containing protein [Marinobacter daepoensis]MBY6080677.1 helix-turn-helix domain-containing protein [Marinobacter daepoensis]